MRTLALMVVLALVALPLVACGVSGSIDVCKGDCESCNDSGECCQGKTCNFATDGISRCSSGQLACKLSP